MRLQNLTNPFENLEDFKDLRTLVGHILISIEVKDVTVHLPSVFDTKLINNPDEILPVGFIVVGNATFEYIRYKAGYVLSSINNRIEKINQDRDLSIEDKMKSFAEVKKKIWADYQYFDSMNPIRYMSKYKWKISYDEEENESTVRKERNYPNSKIALDDGHWNMVANTFSIRRHLLYEILYLVDVELQKLQEELSDTEYTWKGKDAYEVHELLYALLASDRIKYEKGSESTFAHEFLALFGISDTGLSIAKSKVLGRKKRSHFLTVLEEALEKHGKKQSNN